MLVQKLSSVLYYAFSADKEQASTPVDFFYPVLHSLFSCFYSDVLLLILAVFLTTEPLELSPALFLLRHRGTDGAKNGVFFVLTMQMFNFHSLFFFLTSLQVICWHVGVKPIVKRHTCTCWDRLHSARHTTEEEDQSSVGLGNTHREQGAFMLSLDPSLAPLPLP